MFATNGIVVMRSLNRGCDWTHVWGLEQIPTPDRTATSTESVIREVHVSESKLATGRVFVTVEQLAPISKPRVFLSTDSGTSFRPAERGLETAVGSPDDIATSPSSPGLVYLLTDTSQVPKTVLPDVIKDQLPPGSAGVAQSLYVSNDGGEEWEVSQRHYPGDPYDAIEVDPYHGDNVWLYGGKGAEPAPTLGGTGNPVPGPTGYVDIWHAQGGPARILATMADSARAYRSIDGGRLFVTVELPGVANSVVSLGPLQEMYATTAGVYFYTHGRGFTNESPADGRPILELHMTDGAGTEFWGRTESTIERRVINQPAEEDLDLCRRMQELGFNLPGCGPDLDIEFPCVAPPQPGEPALKPQDVVVKLKQGQTKTINYDFDLPTRGQPLDVFFLIDVSGSMQDAIDGTGRAMTEIVTRLTNAGIDVNFGVGEYRAYNAPPVYRRVVDIVNDCGAIEEALEGLIASGGGDETQLEALYQVAAGHTRPGFQVTVPEGQDATWRPDSQRVIVHTTDEPFSEGPPNPSYPEVEEQLDNEDIMQIGIAIEDAFGGGGGGLPSGTSTNNDPPSEGLRNIAVRTEATATGDVDCDGDGDADLVAGDPLVCKVNPLRARQASAMGPAILNQLRSIADPVNVEFETPTGDVVIEKGPPELIKSDFSNPGELGFPVTFSCPRLHTTKRFPVVITAQAADITDRAVATVICQVPPPEKKIPPIVAALPLIPFLPPPPVPPEIPPAPNPNPNPNPNPQSQAQAQAQGAMAHQEQQQPQLAYVYAEEQARLAAATQQSAGGKESEFAMSSYSKDSDGVPPEAIFLLSAMTMSAAYGCLTLARERVRVEHVRRRR